MDAGGDLPGAIGARLHGMCMAWSLLAFAAILAISGLCGSYFCSLKPCAEGSGLFVIYK